MIPNSHINRKGRKKGSINKVSAELKEIITSKASELIDAIDIDALNTNQKLVYLKCILPYVITKQLEIEQSNQFFQVEVIDDFKQLANKVIDWQ